MMGQVSDAIAPLTAKLNIIAFFEVLFKNNPSWKMKISSISTQVTDE
ncbi:hypothetical protein [Laspinema olomoucense]|uniref:Uncharacterized protein n=1 Tax=Laspinema olomoucense D3b TaxID=2953688 RepID=A0ABT2NBT7_9CYAN|nr:hypothetical protein [Laspinema sp. D3b]MCT7980158.1 hypothetical protein [Laspinema sp. D3b]